MSFRVQFVISDDEYKQLKEIAKSKGISISKYVKDKVFEREDSFQDIWEEFKERLDAFPPNVEFDVSTIMSQDRWHTLDKSSKLSLAKLLSKNVASREFSNVVFVGRSSSNVSIYRKQ